MPFPMTLRPVAWIDEAPVRVEDQTILCAGPEAVFATLADHEGWPTWFPGMRRARVEGEPAGVGAVRTVWVGPVAVTEQMVVWEPGREFAFTLTGSAAPGLTSMVEDFALEAAGPDRTRLRYRIGVAGKGPAAVVDPLLRAATRQIVRGGLKGLTGRHGAG